MMMTDLAVTRALVSLCFLRCLLSCVSSSHVLTGTLPRLSQQIVGRFEHATFEHATLQVLVLSRCWVEAYECDLVLRYT